MIINRLNQLYKPKRMLYYIEASGEDIQSFYKGMIPPAVAKYVDCFGVYDYPGVFYVRHLQKEVIGIEFRCNDPRVDYPTELKSLELEESFFYSIEIDDDTEINLPFVRNIFEEIAGEDDAHRPYSDLSMEDAPEIIAVFHDYSKFRILHEWKLYNDRAIHVMKDDYDRFQKEELYKLAFTDHITGNYNWNHLEAFLEVPGDRKIMHDDLSWRNFIKAYVETAIEQDEFVVYLQPKFDIGTEKIKGAEALVRWNYKNKELLPPYRFIPYFEKDATIDKIDDLVLKKICETMSRWKREGKPLYPVSVNLSRMRMNDENLIDKLTDVVDSYGVDHNLIDFELTESASYDNMERMLYMLGELRERGFKISMDDFGTGYSSLSLLTQMPIDTLKIDKSFVDKIAGDAKRNEDIILLRHIINLAKELGFVCLAEGAESRVQIDRLRDLGCEIIQGYYFSKPIPIAEYEETYL